MRPVRVSQASVDSNVRISTLAGAIYSKCEDEMIDLTHAEVIAALLRVQANMVQLAMRAERGEVTEE